MIDTKKQVVKPIESVWSELDSEPYQTYFLTQEPLSTGRPAKQRKGTGETIILLLSLRYAIKVYSPSLTYEWLTLSLKHNLQRAGGLNYNILNHKSKWK